MSTSSTAAQADPSARVLAGPSAVQRARLGALVVFVAVGIVSSCLWAGYPVERISQYRRLERSFSHGYTTIPVPRPAGEIRRHLPQVGRRRLAQDLAASESTSVGRRGLPARASASSSLTAASRCPP